MRFREIFYILDSVDYAQVFLQRDSNATTVYFKNIEHTQEFINQIKNLVSFQTEIEKLEKTLFFTMKKNTPLPPQDAQNIINIINSIIANAKNIHNLIKDLLPPQNDDTISIKMPPISDFSDLVLTMKTLEKAITQVIVHKDIGGYAKVDTWEPGSLWLSIIVGTPIAVRLIGSVVWSATVVYKKLQETKIFEEHAKLIRAKNETIQDLVEGNKRLINELIELEAKNIQNEHFKSTDPEHLERLKNTISTFSELIFRGTEIHPSLTAPESSKELFPPMDAIDTVISKVKAIEDKS